MREKKLAARTRRRFRTTTDSKHDFPIAPNVPDRDFTASAPDRAWVTDITRRYLAGRIRQNVALDIGSLVPDASPLPMRYSTTGPDARPRA